MPKIKRRFGDDDDDDVYDDEDGSAGDEAGSGDESDEEAASSADALLHPAKRRDTRAVVLYSPARNRRALQLPPQVLSPGTPPPSSAATSSGGASPGPAGVPAGGAAGVGAASTAVTTLKLLLWNVENYTRRPRPNNRGMSSQRTRIVRDTLRANGVDIAVLLEAGQDTANTLDQTLANSSYQWHASSLTGRDSEDYGGETYLIGGQAPYQGLDLGIVGEQSPYRGACYTVIAENLHLCALHAPSPGHPLAARLETIGRCVDEAIRRAAGKPLIFCGDLNIKVDDLGALEDALTGPGRGLTFAGPKDPHDRPAETSLRQLRNTILEANRSQPYDQVWYHGSGPSAVEVIRPDFSGVPSWQEILENLLRVREPGSVDDLVTGALTRNAAAPAADQLLAFQRDVDGLIAEIPGLSVSQRNEPLRDKYLKTLRDLKGFSFASNSQLHGGRQALEDINATLRFMVQADKARAQENDAYHWAATRFFVSDHLPLLVTIPQS